MLRRAVMTAGFVLAIAASTASWHARADDAPLTDDQIRALLVRASVALYRGVCPCPWSVDKENRRCGEDSVFNRRSSDAPTCFARQVTREQVARYRALLADERKLAE